MSTEMKSVKLNYDAIRSAYKNNDAATCVLLTERWLRDYPDDLNVTHFHAEMLCKLMRYDEAIRIYLDAIERFTDSDDLWGLYNQVGRLYDHRGDHATGECWYQKAIREDPDESWSYVSLGLSQALQGKLIQAETTFRRAILCADWLLPEAHYHLGEVLRGLGRLAESAECFRKAIELQTTFAGAGQCLKDVERAMALQKEEAEQDAGAIRKPLREL